MSLQMGKHRTKSGYELCANRKQKKSFSREDTEAKQGNYFTGYSWSNCLIWETWLTVCDWLVLRFVFSVLRALTLAYEFLVGLCRLPRHWNQPSPIYSFPAHLPDSLPASSSIILFLPSREFVQYIQTNTNLYSIPALFTEMRAGKIHVLLSFFSQKCVSFSFVPAYNSNGPKDGWFEPWFQQGVL